MILRFSLLLSAILLLGFAEPVPQTKPLEPEAAAQQGRALAEEFLAQQPSQNFTNSGVLKIGRDREVPVVFETLVSPTNWQNVYSATLSNRVETFRVTHQAELPNAYMLNGNSVSPENLFVPFAGSDFWLCDLGLEFFHWPEQRILKSELRKTRLCRVLESVNPHPAPGAYSRVLTWVDTESGGLIHADAYDAAGKIFKEFDPKTVKEVDGQPQLVKMEIYNRQTRSRSQIEFDLPAK